MPDVFDDLIQSYEPPSKKLSASSSNKLVDDKVSFYATKAGLDPNFVGAIIGQESGGNPNAKSWAKASGRLQVMPATGQRFVKNFDPNNDDHVLDAGTQYLAYLNDRYKGDKKRVLAGYNAGEGNADRNDWYEKSQFWSNDPKVQQGLKPRGASDRTNTRNYVDKIYGNYEKLNAVNVNPFDALESSFQSQLTQDPFDALEAGFQPADIPTTQPTPTVIGGGMVTDTRPMGGTVDDLERQNAPRVDLSGQQPQWQATQLPTEDLVTGQPVSPPTQPQGKLYSDEDIEKSYSDFVAFKKADDPKFVDTPEAKADFLAKVKGARDTGAEVTSITTNVPQAKQSSKRGSVTIGKTQGASQTTAQPQTPTQEPQTAGDDVKESGFRIEVNRTSKPKDFLDSEWIIGETASEISKRTGLRVQDVQRELRNLGMFRDGESVKNTKFEPGEDFIGVDITTDGLKKLRDKIDQSKDKLTAKVRSFAESGQTITPDDLTDGEDIEAVTQILMSPEGIESQAKGKELNLRIEAKAKELESEFADTPEIAKSLADIRARERLGLIFPTKASELINKEKEAYKRFQEENKFSAAEEYGFGVSQGERTPEESRQNALKGREAQLQQILKDEGSLSNYYKKQADLEEKYKYRPLARPVEFAANIGRYIAKLPATVVKGLLVGGEIAKLPADYLTGSEYKASANPFYKEAKKWETFVDSTKNEDFKKEFIVNDLANGFGQIISQAILAPLTGGYSLALPIAEAGVSQYEESDKAGASKNVRALSAIVGGLAAVPDALLKAKYFKGLLPEAKREFIENLGKRLFGGLSKNLSQAEASLATKNVLLNLVKNASFGAAGETVQEYSEDVINGIVSKYTYKPQTTWEDIIYPNADRQRGYAVAGVLGAFGGTSETVIEKMSDPELNKASIVLDEAVKTDAITKAEAEELKVTVADELKKRGQTESRSKLEAVQGITKQKGEQSETKVTVQEEQPQLGTKPLAEDKLVEDKATVSDAVEPVNSEPIATKEVTEKPLTDVLTDEKTSEQPVRDKKLVPSKSSSVEEKALVADEIDEPRRRRVKGEAVPSDNQPLSFDRIDADRLTKEGKMPQFYARIGSATPAVYDSTKSNLYDEIKLPKGIDTLSQAEQYVKRLRNKEVTPEYYKQQPVKQSKRNDVDDELTTQYAGNPFTYNGEKLKVGLVYYYEGEARIAPSPPQNGKYFLLNKVQDQLQTPTTEATQKPSDKVKEPYEMTAKEFVDGEMAKEFSPVGQKSVERIMPKFHENSVEKALKEGKSVPQSVLAEYPDLQKKYGKAEQKGKSKPQTYNDAQQKALDKYLPTVFKVTTDASVNPNIGKKWTGRNGDSVVVGYTPTGSGMYVTINDKGVIRNYGDIDKAIARDKESATPEYQAKIQQDADKAEKARAEKEKSEKESKDLRGFGDSLNPMQKGKALVALNKKWRYNNKTLTSKQIIEQSFDDGSLEADSYQEDVIKDLTRTQFNRMNNEQQQAHKALKSERGQKTVYTVNGLTLGKTAYDYAQYLLNTKSETALPTAEIASNPTLDFIPTQTLAKLKGKTKEIVYVSEKTGKKTKPVQVPLDEHIAEEQEDIKKRLEVLQKLKDCVNG